LIDAGFAPLPPGFSGSRRGFSEENATARKPDGESISL